MPSKKNVQDLLEDCEVSGSSQHHIHEVENTLAAYNGVLEYLRTGQVPSLSPPLIAHFNWQVLDGLERAAHVVPGQPRTRYVVVGQYQAPDAAECKGLAGKPLIRPI